MLRNFGFVIDDQLAGLAHPGCSGDLEGALAGLRAEGFTALVSLDEIGIAADLAHAHELAYLHLPVDDFGAPTVPQADRFVSFVDDQLAKGGQVAAHCQAGIGRTGTMLAAYLIAHGFAVEDAVAHVKRRRAPSVESDSQLAFLAEYAAHCAEQTNSCDG